MNTSQSTCSVRRCSSKVYRVFFKDFLRPSAQGLRLLGRPLHQCIVSELARSQDKPPPVLIRTKERNGNHALVFAWPFRLERVDIVGGI